MTNDSIPSDLLAFLQSGRSLEYDVTRCEVGQVLLHQAENIRLVEFEINSEHGAKWSEEDPHADEAGYYIVPALDLVADCQNYRPNGILIYIPSLGVYGNFDEDHRSITYFPRITWWNIVGEPVRYLTGQWRPAQSSINPILNPVGVFPFRPGWD